MFKKQTLRVLLVLPLLASSFVVWGSSAEAAKLGSRQLHLDTTTPSAVTVHHFSFLISTAGTLGSIAFEYCSNDPLIGEPCTAPTGFDISATVLSSQTGETGFTLHAASNANRVILTRAPSAASAGAVTYNFSNVTNPSDPNSTNYVRLTTYASDDATGSYVDEGGLAFSTSGSLGVAAFVPPYLRFCAGVTVTADCVTVTGFKLSLGELSAETPRYAASQLAAFTNDDQGYVISTIGTTMTSGNNVIPAMDTLGPSNPGTGQFGINARSNTNPGVGQDVSGTGTGIVEPNYDVVDNFQFVSGDVLAESIFPTEANVFTVSYIVNIPEDQAPGVYVTTLTYVATAQF